MSTGESREICATADIVRTPMLCLLRIVFSHDEWSSVVFAS